MKFVSVAIAVVFISGCTGPLGPIPGGSLGGETSSFPGNWDFASSADHVQLETLDSEGNPYSVNTWAGVVDSRLFVPTSLVRGADEPADRQWVRNAMANNSVRIRVTGKLYMGVIAKVLDDSLAEQAKGAIFAKYGSEPDARSELAWVFEISPVPNG